MKRNEDFKNASNSKKPKLEQEVDDMWGDDPEIDEIDRCIHLATQICSQSTDKNNLNQTLGFASYDDFQRKANLCTSTQVFFPPVPSTSSAVRRQVNNSTSSSRSSVQIVVNEDADQELPKLLQKVKSLESEKKKLTELYDTKNGEITILRTKLTSAQKLIDNEKMETLRIAQENQQKWDAKCNALNKELSSLKCDIELKNLEVTNLREKLSELKKVLNSNLNMSILTEELNINETLLITNTKIKGVQTDNKQFSYPFKSFAGFPLQNTIPISVFEKCNENNCSVNLRSFGSNLVSSYRNNFTISTLSNSENPAKPIKSNLICINHLYPEIQKLLQSTEEELNNSEIINKIVSTSEQSLIQLLNYLKRFEQELSFDDIENMDNLYLEQNDLPNFEDCIFSGRSWHENETAVDIRRYIAIISALCLHCDKVLKYITTPTEEINGFNSNDRMETDEVTELKFLNIVLDVVNIIQKIRRSEQFCGLLAAVLKLLSNISQKGTLSAECYEQMYQIFKQIIFSRPNKSVLKYVCEFLKNISFHEIFLEKLCNLKKSDIMQSNIIDGLLYFSEDSCTFRILATQLETCDLNTRMSCHVIQFLENTVTCNVSWMYHPEQKCECLVEMYSLAINILCNISQRHAAMNKHAADKIEEQLCYTIFHVGLIFLNILTVRISDLVVRCHVLYPQYHAIIKYINDNRDKLFLKKIHEVALEHLVSQFNYDAQKQCKVTSNSVSDIFRKNFSSF